MRFALGLLLVLGLIAGCSTSGPSPSITKPTLSFSYPTKTRCIEWTHTAKLLASAPLSAHHAPEMTSAQRLGMASDFSDR